MWWRWWSACAGILDRFGPRDVPVGDLPYLNSYDADGGVVRVPPGSRWEWESLLSLLLLRRGLAAAPPALEHCARVRERHCLRACVFFCVRAACAAQVDTTVAAFIDSFSNSTDSRPLCVVAVSDVAWCGVWRGKRGGARCFCCCVASHTERTFTSRPILLHLYLHLAEF